MDKKGFSLLEVTISMFIMGLTITALLNLLDWSNLKYKVYANSWKERNCLTEARIWIRNQILKNNNLDISIKSLKENVKCPYGFGFCGLDITQKDKETYFIKVSIYEDKNRNGIAERDETTARLFCFRRRSVWIEEVLAFI